MYIKLFIIIFVLLSLVMMVTGHAGLWISFIKFFSINSLMVKEILGIFLGIMSISFIVGMGLVHWHETPFISNLYLISAVWLGMVWYIALSVSATWGFIWLGRYADIKFPIMAISIVLLVAAVAYSSYGIWNAFHPRVKSINVSIRDLPDYWQGKKIIQLSDIHLGTIYHRGFMNKLVKQVNELNPDIIFLTGDLFDGAGQKLNHLAEPINDFKVTHGTYYIDGNHETYIGLEAALKAVSETSAITLRDELIEIEGLQILGIDYPMPGAEHDLKPVLNKLDNSRPSIVLYHEPKEQVWKMVKEAGVDLLLSGHTHKGQMWPFGWIAKLVYGDYYYGLHTDNDFTIYTSNGVGTWGPPMRIGNFPEIVEITLEKK
ncbi:MAG: metallophosphoesterase [Candidatus Kerfeldbacteria bacterium]